MGGGLRVTLAAGVLAAAVDAVLGVGAGAAVELVARAAVWGRRARPPWWARAAAFVLAGAGGGRRGRGRGRGDRAAQQPLPCRRADGARGARGGGRRRRAGARRSRGCWRVGARGPSRTGRPGRRPCSSRRSSAAIAAAAIFVPLSARPVCSPGPRCARGGVDGAVPAALLPCGRRRRGLAPPRDSLAPGAVALAGIAYGGAAAFALARSWGDNLRFAPWTEIAVGAVIAAVGALLCWTARGRLPDEPVSVALLAAAFWFAAVGITLPSSTIAARAQGRGRARRLRRRRRSRPRRGQLDFDGDGFARALGGGDCDDRDPLVHPGAPDIPGDGVDADCDGEDATDALPPPARMVDLPATVPPDLNLLLVTIDTLRADHIGSYGYPRPTSPAIDALAAEGALFENGWAHAPSTRYSMPAIAAGRWPSAITWDESIWWPRLGPDGAHDRAGAARRRLLHGRSVQLQLLRARRSSRLRARHGRLPRRARGAARRRERADGVARFVVARDHRRRDRVRRRASRQEVLPLDPLLRSAPGVRDASRGAVVRDVARRSLRRRDPLHRPAPRSA